MPGLAAIVDSLESVPESLHEHYQPQGDKFVLAVEGAEEAFAKPALRTKEALLTEKKKLGETLTAREQELAQYKDLGMSAEDIKKIVDEKNAIEQKKLEESGNFQKIIEANTNKHLTELTAQKTAAQQREEFLKGQLHTEILERQATEALVAAEAYPKIMKPIVMSALRMVEEDGKIAVRVIGADNNPRLSVKTGEYMTPAEYVAELKADKEYSGGFKGTGASGSGAPSVQRKTAAGGADTSSMTPLQKIQFGFQQQNKR